MVERTGDDGVPRLELGRGNHGGMHGYWFCIECNNRTGRWDEEYVQLHRHLVHHLHDGPEPPRQHLVGSLPQVDVGAVARSMWAWSFALLPGLFDRYPAVAHAVRTGEPVEPPADIDLLLALTMSLRFWATAQPDGLVVTQGGERVHQRSSGLVVAGPRIETVPITAVASPPFSVVLAHRERPVEVPHAVVSEWLRDPAGISRDVAIALPMIEVEGEGTPGPLSYSSFRPVPSSAS